MTLKIEQHWKCEDCGESGVQDNDYRVDHVCTDKRATSLYISSKGGSTFETVIMLEIEGSEFGIRRSVPHTELAGALRETADEIDRRGWAS